MQLVIALICVVLVLAYSQPDSSYMNSTLSSCSYSATCSAGGVSGVCVSISAGCCSGTTTANLCPGSSDIKCCTNNKCSTPSGSGVCEQTSLCSSQGGSSIAGYCVGPTDVKCCVHGSTNKISRTEIISRAQDWVNRKIPYSQSATTDGYRQDCSGYVSMSWKSSQPGHTTYDMQNICTKITKGEMQKGDALLKPSEHVLLFDSWVDSDQFMEYAEHTTGQVASHDKTSYSYYVNNGFFPCRYNLVA